jgi:lysozyme
MQTSSDGRTLIEGFETLELTAYLDCRKILTIGYGHTGKDVYAGMTITEEQADDLLEQDLNTAETCINENVKVSLEQYQFDALVSFTFNVGVGNFTSSTLLKLLNAGDYTGASQQFPRWNKSGGVVLSGLIRRRNAEQAMFLNQDWQSILSGE